MKLKEAKTLRNQNLRIIGKEYKGDEISDILIVPENGSLSKIFEHVIMGNDYSYLLSSHTQFKVIVLLNFEEASFNGVYKWEVIEKVLNHFSS